MEACLSERDFECRSANWYRHLSECSLTDQDRHSISQQHTTNSLYSQQQQQHQYNWPLDSLFGPSNATTPTRPPAQPPGLYQNYYHAAAAKELANSTLNDYNSPRSKRQTLQSNSNKLALVGVDYLENNCVQEPNKLCEFGKIQNRVLKTVDSIYQDVGSLEECKQKCLSAPYRCHSFDYGDTSERVCRTSHLDQASLTAIKEPYLEVAGAVTYELAACFNVTVQCKAREMLVQVASSKSFRGRIYAKSRPNTCLNDVTSSLKFNLTLKYHEPQVCDVRLTTTNSSSLDKQQQQLAQQGLFSTEIIIQHHDRIVTSQDVGLQVNCQYDLSDRSIVSTVDLAVERFAALEPMSPAASAAPHSFEAAPVESKTNPKQQQSGPITITSLATTVVKSPNVAMKITNLNGSPVTSATVGDRLALMFEIKDKTSKYEGKENCLFGLFISIQ